MLAIHSSNARTRSLPGVVSGTRGEWRRDGSTVRGQGLAAIREQGWSVNDAEPNAETRAVAAALLRPDGASLAAFVLCGPSTRFGSNDLPGYGRLVASLTTEWQARADPDSSAGPRR
jgi:DNA-binding IclR family transcriptional regulator